MYFSNNDLNIFASIMEGSAKKTSDSQNNISFYKGTVTAVQADNKKATVRLTSSDTKTVTLINKVSDKLSVGDGVLVLSFDSVGGNVSNGIIAYKFGQSTGWNGTYKTGDTTQRTVTVVNGIIVSCI